MRQANSSEESLDPPLRLCHSQTDLSHTEGYLQLFLFLLHHCPDDAEGGVGEAEHEQQRKLVLDGDEEWVRDVRWEREPLGDHTELLEQLVRRGVGMVMHDGFVYSMLHCQEALTDVP